MPQGGWVGIPVLGIRRDERFYERVESYEPFRYVQIKECGEAETLKGSSARYEDALEAGRPTATYLGFGYGRHAWCVHEPLPTPYLFPFALESCIR